MGPVNAADIPILISLDKQVAGLAQTDASAAIAEINQIISRLVCALDCTVPPKLKIVGRLIVENDWSQSVNEVSGARFFDMKQRP